MAAPSQAALSRERSAGCDGCHGVVGFLARIGAREASPPRDPLGITCAACHAPHGNGSSDALIRRVTLPSRFGALDPDRDAATRICIACHGPLADERDPAQSAASLWFGDEPARTLAPHRAVPGGCVGCHMRAQSGARPDGSGHAFRADRARCKSCHANGTANERVTPAGRISVRARAIWARLAARGVVPDLASAPPHALAPPVDRVPEPLARAASSVRLVLEDPAAWVHNGPRARALLDEAEPALESTE
jgi:hypothetical protein